VDEWDYMKNTHDGKSEHYRENPPARSERKGSTANTFPIEVHACHEKRGSHPEGEHRRKKPVELHQPQAMRTDDYSEHDFQHYDWNAEAKRNCRKQRRYDGRKQYPEDRMAC
jgi:hypothetical protein